MSPKQKAVIWVGILLIVAMGLYPPWVRTGTYPLQSELQFQTKQYIHGWLFFPPHAAGQVNERDAGEAAAKTAAVLYWTVQLDIPRLLVQWTIVAFGALGTAWTLHQKR